MTEASKMAGIVASRETDLETERKSMLLSSSRYLRLIPELLFSSVKTPTIHLSNYPSKHGAQTANSLTCLVYNGHELRKLTILVFSCLVPRLS